MSVFLFTIIFRYFTWHTIMKKIIKKRFKALLRKYWKNKPYLCATVAVLSLIMLTMLFKKPDTVSAFANLCMAGAALYAAYNAKDWLDQEHYNSVKKFRSIMNNVDKKLLDYVLENNRGKLEYALAFPLFAEADNYINVICVDLLKEHEERLRDKYYSFKGEHILYWMDLRDHSQSEYYVNKYHPDFYSYLTNKSWTNN